MPEKYYLFKIVLNCINLRRTGAIIYEWILLLPGLKIKRVFLLVFILLQAGVLLVHLNYQKSCIEYNAEKTLRNTALLKSESFETSLAAMRYQIRVVGNALLLDHTVSVEKANLFLAEELKRPWLDGIIVFNDKGDFVAKQNYFSIENTLDPTTVALQSFRENTIFKNYVVKI